MFQERFENRFSHIAQLSGVKRIPNMGSTLGYISTQSNTKEYVACYVCQQLNTICL